LNKTLNSVCELELTCKDFYRFGLFLIFEKCVKMRFLSR
jgi:hypothetical protein